MKKQITLTSLLLLLGLFTHAQFGGLIDKAKKKAEKEKKEAEKKIENKVDNKIDNIGNQNSNTANNPSQTSNSNNTKSSNSTTNSKVDYEGQTPDADGFIKKGSILWNPEIRFFRDPRKPATNYLYNPERGNYGIYPHEEINSEYHKKNFNKLVFSGSTIQNDNPEGKEQSTFNSTDSIYFTMFLPNTFCNYMLKAGWLYDTLPNTYKIGNNDYRDFALWASVDGGKFERVFENAFPKEDPGKTKNTFAICKGLVEGIQQPEKGWKEWIEKMPAGQHEVDIQIWGGQGGGNGKDNVFPKKGNWSTDSAVATGHIKINKKEGALFPDIYAHFQKYYYQSELVRYWKEFKTSRAKDDAPLNDFQKSNVGKILFAKKELPETESNLTASYSGAFTGADKIYFSVFLDTSLYNKPLKLDDTTKIKYDSRDVSIRLKHYNDQPIIFTKEQTISLLKLRPFSNDKQEYYVKIYIDDVILSDVPELQNLNRSWNRMIEGSAGDDSTERAIKVIERGYNHMNDMDWSAGTKLDSWPVIANALSPGEHKVRFDFYSGDYAFNTGKIASGTFTYTKTAGFVVPYGYNLKDYWDKCYMQGSGTEAEFKAQIAAVLSKEGSKLLKFGITSNDWVIEKNGLDIIKGKFINVQFAYKGKDGYINFSTGNFYKQYSGAGTYGKTRGPEEIGSGEPINPASMK